MLGPLEAMAFPRPDWVSWLQTTEKLLEDRHAFLPGESFLLPSRGGRAEGNKRELETLSVPGPDAALQNLPTLTFQGCFPVL